MSILKGAVVSSGLDDVNKVSLLDTLSASERKAYSNFLSLGNDKRKEIADVIEAGGNIDPALKLGYDTYNKLFNKQK